MSNGVQSNGIVKYRGLRRCREVRSAIRDFIRPLVKCITKELKQNGLKNGECVDSLFRLLGQQMAEVRKWDERIEDIAPVDIVYDFVKESRDYLLDVVGKIESAAVQAGEREVVLTKFQYIFQRPAPYHQRVYQLPPAKKLAMENKLSGLPVEANRSIAQRQRVIKLPVLEMPKFSGDLMEWVEFWDTFEREIHNDQTMPNVHKFSYLKALLQGADLDFIKKVRITDANYERAVTILKSRYGNVEKLVSLHKAALLNLEHVKENCGNLREFFRAMESNVCALESLDVEIDPSLIASLFNKLPSDVKKRVCQKRQLQDGDGVTIDALRDALNVELQ